MKNRFHITFFISALLLCTNCSPKINLKSVLPHAEAQTNLMLEQFQIAKRKANNPALISPRTIENNELKLVASTDWTSGFFAGQLWLLYELTGKDSWREKAQEFTAPLEREKLNGVTHDMGFKIYNSFGNSYRLAKTDHAKEVILQSAKTLATRFNRKVGAIRSWDHHEYLWKFPVIIDNMINLELLFEATKLSGDSSYHKIAVSHANATLKNHYRDDNSSWHVVDYNPVTGEVVKKQTHQGFSDSSAWARGQAWGLYGFTMCYRETNDIRYLQQAEKIAAFIFSRPSMPADLVPYWDYDAAGIPNEPRDASAAVVAASALYELSTYSSNKKLYLETADKILKNIEAGYKSAPGANKGFILDHSTGNKPANSEIDVPINYADYYYLEALIRKSKLN
jgi:rhamnogalacturonyl hydrolase YesR